MKSDEFGVLFPILEKSSERTRTILYTFLVINFAAFLFVFSFVVYSRSTERLKEFEKYILCIGNVPLSAQRLFPKLKECSELDFEIGDQGYAILKTMSNEIGAGNFRELKALKSKTLELLASERIASHKFSIPILGISIEADYFWMIHSYFGVLGLIIIAATFRREQHNFEYLYDGMRTFSRAQLCAIQSTQMITPQINQPASLLKPFFPRLQKLLLLSVIWLPIIVELLLISYELYVIDILKMEATFADSTRYLRADFCKYPAWTSFKLIVEFGAVGVMIFLASYISAASQLQTDNYNKIEKILHPCPQANGGINSNQNGEGA